MVSGRHSSPPISLGVLVCSVALGVFVVLYGCLLNGNQHKYARYHADSCQEGVFIRDLESSEFCCEDIYHRSDWVCVAAYDTINKIWSSLLAWVVPLVPIVMTIFSDYLTGHLAGNKWMHMNRMSAYVGLFIYRTVRVLFLIV